MPSRSTWAQKVAKPGEPVVKPLDKPFAGHDVGDLMLISTPVEIDRRGGCSRANSVAVRHT